MRHRAPRITALVGESRLLTVPKAEVHVVFNLSKSDAILSFAGPVKALRPAGGCDLCLHLPHDRRRRRHQHESPLTHSHLSILVGCQRQGQRLLELGSKRP